MDLDENFKIQGKILIDMDCELKDNSTRSLNDELEIDILLKNNEFRGSTKQLKIDNYSYDYDDNYLILHISCVLDEGGENTMDLNEKDISTKEIVNSKIEPLRGELSSDEISELEELFNRKDVEVISTISNEESVEDEKENIDKQTPISTNQRDSNQTNECLESDRKCSCEENNELKENNDIENNNISNDENIEPIIIEEILEKEMEPSDDKEMNREESMINVVKEPKKDNNILVEEGYSIFATFYRVHEGDTYSSISLKHNCNEQKLMMINNNMELKEGLLVRIPK